MNIEKILKFNRIGLWALILIYTLILFRMIKLNILGVVVIYYKNIPLGGIFTFNYFDSFYLSLYNNLRILILLSIFIYVLILGYLYKDKFDGYLFKKNKDIYISFIFSRNKRNGNLTQLFNNILNKGFNIKVPIPFPLMQLILNKKGFIKTIEKDKIIGDIEVWVKKYNIGELNEH